MQHDDVVYWIAKYHPYINRYAWFNGHDHANYTFGISGSEGHKDVKTEACKEAENGIARLVEVYSDNCVEMRFIYGASAAAKVTSADTAIYEDANKLGGIETVGTKE